jgi:hypothetical protein
LRSFKVELLRHGTSTGAIQDRYLVAMDGLPVRSVAPRNVNRPSDDPDDPPLVQQQDVLRALDCMRYRETRAPADEQETGRRDAEKAQALKLLRGLVAQFLRDVPGWERFMKGVPRTEPPEIMQIDLVTDNVELWALPFEFVQDGAGRDLLGDRERPVLLTRRIRQSFAERARPWPEKPRVLFAWAGNVDASRHRDALYDALGPWIGPLSGTMIRDPRPVLTELQNATLGAVEAACAAAASGARPRPYTHVHLLAHGEVIPDPIAQLSSFGVALASGTVTPEELAKALRAGQPDGPTVVTLAICDSSNASNTILAGGRVAYELHARGVPVVVGSQFPLTEPGAAVHADTFYGSLLAGAKDVRVALCDACAALRASGVAGHDWASINAHVSLPEGYADQIRDAGLRVELAQLNSASRWAQPIVEDRVPVSKEEAAGTEERLQQRIDSLRGYFLGSSRGVPEAVIVENRGLLASAYKRLSELVFCNGGDGAAERSRRLLLDAGELYYQAHDGALSQHWPGTQHLAITAVTTGSIPGDRTIHWGASLHAARTEARADPKADDKTRGQVLWALGSIAELSLLHPLLAAPDVSPPAPGAAREALDRLVSLAEEEPQNRDVIDSTWRQLRRYVHWWTIDRGFFPGRPSDLASPAAELADRLEPHTTKKQS